MKSAHDLHLRALALAVSLAGFLAPARAQPALTPETLQQLLRQYPDADANRDGVLSEAEARSYYNALRGRKASATAPIPTLTDVAYGPHTRNVLDFWQAPAANSGHPAPVVVYIHGGGFISGDKSFIRRSAAVQQCLDAGVSFAAINYRYLSPRAPIQDVLRDCARAIQFLRTRAADWHIDKSRIASHGDSAGAGASLWIAAHPDLADAGNTDPVLRESTRLTCVGLNSTQFSYDWLRWTDVFGAEVVQRFGDRYNSPEFYGFATAEDLRSPAGQKIRADCDMLGLLTKNTPPVFMSLSLPDLALTNTNQFLHHPKHSQLIYERCRELGIPVIANIAALQISPAANEPKTWRDFLFQQLGVKPPAATSASP